MGEGNGLAIAIGLGAVVLVYFLTQQQERNTTAMIAAAQQRANAAAQMPKTLSFADGVAIVGTVAATYFGGPGAGKTAAETLAPK